MKRLYMSIAITLFVALTIIYFQILLAQNIAIPFFSKTVDLKGFLFYIIVISFFWGMFFTLTLKGFLFKKPDELDGNFEL